MKVNLSNHSFNQLAGLFLLILSTIYSQQSFAQFYTGSNIEFGKNRVQYENFEWKFYRFDKYETYFYTGGQEIAEYTAQYAHTKIAEQEKFFDYYLDEPIQFVIYNKHSDFKQSNIGVGADASYSIGGVTRIVGSKIFLYFEGDYKKLNQQIDAGITEVLIYQMMYGGSWKDMIKNSALLTIPSWYVNGLVSYLTYGNDPTIVNKIKDGIANNAFEKFNRLDEKDATIASHAMWTFIAEKYDPKTISNILYLTRITRDVEDGLLYSIGVSFESITADWTAYYQENFMDLGQDSYAENHTPIDTKIKKNRTYQQFKVSPDGDKVAFTTNQRGQYRIYILDKETGKKKQIFKDEHKLDRIVDYSYPILEWHPTGKLLTFFVEEKGFLQLFTYDMEEEKLYQKNIFNLEKVLSYDYAPDGKKMVLSAVFRGQTDLYLYTVGGNTQKKLTDDVFDDLDPVFVENGNAIAFASNRKSDSLEPKSIEFSDLQYETDIFVLNYTAEEPKLIRVSTTEELAEKQPIRFKGNLAYLEIEDAIYQRKIAQFDSSVSRIDTIIHYDYFYKEIESTNYDRSISEQNNSQNSTDYSEIVYADNTYLLVDKNFNRSTETSKTSKKLSGKKGKNNATEASPKMGDNQLILQSIPAQNVAQEARIVKNYTFEKEPQREVKKETKKRRSTVITTLQPKDQAKPFILSNQRNYNLNFKIDNSALQLNNSFLTGQYQVFTGRPYNNPGLGVALKYGIVDLMEDYRVYGGFRFAGETKEVLFGYQNLKKQVDKEYIISYTRQRDESAPILSNLNTLRGVYSLIYPFSEVTSIRATFSARNDRSVPLSISQNALETDISNRAWGSAKLAYVFDNTRNIALNIKYGTRMKFFGEYYQKFYDQSLASENENMAVVGFDMRHYQKISRQLIFVTRLAGSSSFGNNKLIYYMGGVDEWWNVSDKFRDTKIDRTQNYSFQTLATNMRGHLQNTKNGNNFVVANAELRFPVFSYFIRKPIQSDFVRNFQLIGFADAGTAWVGTNPFEDKNPSSTEEIDTYPFSIDVYNLNDPIIGGFGFGLRSTVLGYFVRADWAWGVENRAINSEYVFYLSLSLDI
tara:strand:- start:4420 stop:7689 length:3270 start_codon:yes stop_codon:yes gene_type:complete